MRSTKPTHPLRGILNLEIGKIESDDECVHRQETWHCCPARREANQGLPDLRRRAGRHTRQCRTLCGRVAAALARDYGLYVTGFCGSWRGRISEGVPGLSRGRDRSEPGCSGRRLHAVIWVVWGNLVLASEKTAKISQVSKVLHMPEKPKAQGVSSDPGTPDPETSSHILVRPLYAPSDLADWDYDQQLGYPGDFPYTRGIQPTMYRGRTWTMRQYAGMGDAEESNKRYKYLLEQGTTGLSVAFDLPTQIGFDSDHSLAAGEVGKVGVAIDSIEDMERLFDGIDLTRISTSMTINATASILLALYVAVARRRGADIRNLSGTVQNDILKEYIARGTYIYPVARAMRIVTDLFAWTNESVPEWNTISISGYHMREAGATAVQEVAFTLANGSAYVQAAVDAGLDVDVFGPRISFFFNAHSNFLEEVAKFRAARRMWAHIMREKFGAKNPRSWMLRFHPPPAPSTLTSHHPPTTIPHPAL